MKAKFFMAALASTFFVTAGFAQSNGNLPDRAELVKFVKVQAQDEPAYKQNADTILAVIARLYDEPATLKDSEREIVVAALGDFRIATRGGRSKMSDLMGGAPVMSNAAPTPPPPVVRHSKSPKSTVPVAHTAPKPPITHAPAAAPKLKALRHSVTFVSGTRKIPGSKTFGYVDLIVDGRKKTLVEIPSSEGFPVAKRASIVRSRFLALQTADPLWWMKLTAGTVNSETVVKSPRAKGGVVVTADKPYAKECGQDPDGLAKLLISQIRNGFEATTSQLATRDVSPEEQRATAVSLRQEADELYESKPDQAIGKYLKAVSTDDGDPTYHVPYLRLATIYKSKGSAAKAKEILEKGIQQEGMGPDALAELKAAAAKL